jgi:hypothetical protein
MPAHAKRVANDWSVSISDPGIRLTFKKLKLNQLTFDFSDHSRWQRKYGHARKRIRHPCCHPEEKNWVRTCPYQSRIRIA